MPRIVFTTADGDKVEVSASVGTTVMEAGRDENLGLEGTCGGCLSCATCHVIVDEAWADKLSPITDDETDMLDMTDLKTDHSRLGCQIEMSDALDGIEITIPEQY